jgi:hypothetical protein
MRIFKAFLPSFISTAFPTDFPCSFEFYLAYDVGDAILDTPEVLSPLTLHPSPFTRQPSTLNPHPSPLTRQPSTHSTPEVPPPPLPPAPLALPDRRLG